MVAVAIALGAPAAAQAAWSGAIPLGFPAVATGGLNSANGVACPSTTQCTAVDTLGEEATLDPLAPGSPKVAKVDPDVATGPAGILAIACPTVTQCTVVDGAGRVATFNPQAPALATPTSLGGGEDSTDGIACPSSTQCTVVGNGAATFNPQSPGSPTLNTDIGIASDLRSVACPSVSLCTTVDGEGDEVTFDPNAFSTATTATIGSSFTTVSCPSATQCSAVGTEEVTFNPNSAAATAQTGNIDSPLNYLYGLDCPSTGQCTATDLSGNAFTFDPNNPGTPTPTAVDDDHSNFGSVACPAIGECAAVDGKVDVFIEPAPAASGGGSGGGTGGGSGGGTGGGSGGGTGGGLGGGHLPGKPSISHVVLSGLATGRPRLAFTATAGRAIRSLTIHLPKGMSFGLRAKHIAKGLSVSASGHKLKYEDKVARQALVFVFRGTARSIRVSIVKPALAMTKTLENKVKHKRVNGLSLTLTVTDSAHRTTTLIVKG